MSTEPGTPAPALAEAIKQARSKEELGVRELSRLAGISHTQISRLESGKVATPSREALVAIARGLDRSPIPLLCLAGHFDRDETVLALRRMNVHVYEGNDELQVAFDAFLSPSLGQLGRWDDTYLLEAAQGERAQPLKELMDLWRRLTPPLRASWLELGHSLLELQDQSQIDLENLDGLFEEEYEAREEQLYQALREADQRLKNTDPDQLLEFSRALVELTDRAEENDL